MLTGRVKAQLLQDLIQRGWETGELEFLAMLFSGHVDVTVLHPWLLCVVSMFKSIQPQRDTHSYSHT